MTNVLSYLSKYFGNKDLSEFPGLLEKSQPKSLDIAIIQANYSVLYDLSNETRIIDWKSL